MCNNVASDVSKKSIFHHLEINEKNQLKLNAIYLRAPGERVHNLSYIFDQLNISAINQGKNLKIIGDQMFKKNIMSSGMLRISPVLKKSYSL